jgi:hypothetical protein
MEGEATDCGQLGHTGADFLYSGRKARQGGYNEVCASLVEGGGC